MFARPGFHLCLSAHEMVLPSTWGRGFPCNALGMTKMMMMMMMMMVMMMMMMMMKMMMMMMMMMK